MTLVYGSPLLRNMQSSTWLERLAAASHLLQPSQVLASLTAILRHVRGRLRQADQRERPGRIL